MVSRLITYYFTVYNKLSNGTYHKSLTSSTFNFPLWYILTVNLTMDATPNQIGNNKLKIEENGPIFTCFVSNGVFNEIIKIVTKD